MIDLGIAVRGRRGDDTFSSHIQMMYFQRRTPLRAVGSFYRFGNGQCRAAAGRVQMKRIPMDNARQSAELRFGEFRQKASEFAQAVEAYAFSQRRCRVRHGGFHAGAGQVEQRIFSEIGNTVECEIPIPLYEYLLRYRKSVSRTETVPRSCADRRWRTPAQRKPG